MQVIHIEGVSWNVPTQLEAKYVPVVRYRQEERKGLKSLKLTSKILPLIEILREKPDNRKTSTFALYQAELASFGIPVIVDIPMHPSLTSVANNVQVFLQTFKADPATRITKILSLSRNNQLIPAVSYNADSKSTYSSTYIRAQVRQFRKAFANGLAFRVFATHFKNAVQDVITYAEDHDIVLLDIDEAPITSVGVSDFISRMLEVRKKTGAKIGIIRSAIPRSVKNINLGDGNVIPEADNSLRDNYGSLGFDMFGDYAGLKNELPPKGIPSISPGVIFYSRHNNTYVGFGHGNVKGDLSQFKTRIVPNIIKSPEWALYSESHRSTCPGCSIIHRVSQGIEDVGNQGKWKRVAFTHYLQSMNESL